MLWWPFWWWAMMAPPPPRRERRTVVQAQIEYMVNELYEDLEAEGVEGLVADLRNE